MRKRQPALPSRTDDGRAVRASQAFSLPRIGPEELTRLEVDQASVGEPGFAVARNPERGRTTRGERGARENQRDLRKRVRISAERDPMESCHVVRVQRTSAKPSPPGV